MESNQRPQVVLVSRCFILHQGRFLIIQRSANDSHLPGYWEVPGGKLDGGQDLTSGLRREVKEETGLTILPVSFPLWAKSEVIKKGKYAGLAYVVLFGLAKFKSGEVRVSHEHDNYDWTDLKAAKNVELTPETAAAIKVFKDYLSK